MSHRRTWSDFPAPLRSRLETILGGPVVQVRSCMGGFSPSGAEILISTTGRTVFVKAVRDRDNPGSVDLNRREAGS